MTSFVTLFIVCAFSMPVICVPAHADGKSLMTAQLEHETGLFKKIDASKDSKTGKSMTHDNCCLGHHCCAAKIVTPLELGVLTFYSTPVKLSIYVDQHIPDLNINSLDRPPKSLV